MKSQLSILVFLLAIVIGVLGVGHFFGSRVAADEGNLYLDKVYLSEVKEGQNAITINEDGTSSVVCFDNIEMTAGIPDKYYNIVVREITDKKIVVDVGSKDNYDGLSDIVVGFKTTKEINPSCVVQISCYDLETDKESYWEFKR